MTTMLEVVEPSGAVLQCSFCARAQKDVKSLIAGPSAYICNECVALCNDILGEEVSAAVAVESRPAEPGPDAQAVLAFGEGVYLLRATALLVTADAPDVLRRMQQAMVDLRAADRAGRLRWNPISDEDIERIGRVADAISSGAYQTAAGLAEASLTAAFGKDWPRVFGP